MKRNLKRHLDWELEEGFDWTQWQAIQIKSLRGYREESAKIIDYAFEQAAPGTEQFITEAFHDGAGNFDAQISIEDLSKAHLDVTNTGAIVWRTDAEPAQGVVASIPEPKLDQIPDESFFPVNKAKLDACINDTHNDFERVRFAAANRMGAGYEEILKKADIFMQTGTMTLTQAVDMASKDFLAAGLNCVEYENGRRVNITSYVEMALRTSSRRAALTAEGAKRDEWNEHLVISPTLGSTCPHCQKWQGIVLIDDVYSNGKPDGVHPLLSKAVDDDFLHPQCRHPLVTFFEGITPMPTASPFEQTRLQYEAEKRQRQIELMLRKYKRLRDGSLDPDNQRKYDLKVKEWEGILKQHLKNYPELRRKPEREKSVGPAEKLPSVENAKIEDTKIFEYLLNPNHPVGKHKAIVLERVLGYNNSNGELLREEIYRKVQNEPITLKVKTEFGYKYEVHLTLIGVRDRILPVNTVWEIKQDQTSPRFITLTFLRKERE